jgi:uracil-DNA glycosylase family 4
MLSAAGMNLNEEIYIANIVKCRPPNNRVPKSQEISTCVKFLNKQIEIIRPQILLLLGRTAIKGLFKDIDTYMKSSIDFLRKESKESNIRYQGHRVLITYHPSAVLRNRALIKDKVKEDFSFLKSFVQDNLLIPR